MRDVLRATYADLKTVKTRSVCQLVLELPIEALTDVVGLLGAPIPGNEVWVAVARLRPEAARLEAPTNEDRPPAKLSQIAGILCNEGRFRAFLRENAFTAATTDEAAAVVRLVCGVKSRADLDTNEQAAGKFRDLRGQYEAWMLAPEAVA